MNISQWIDCVADTLRGANLHYGHGTECAADEAAWLVLHATGHTPDADPAVAQVEVSPRQAERIEALVAARVEHRVPLAYLIGRAWFAGLEFEVDPAVLVPRSPIAELVIEQFAPWHRSGGIRSVLDLCTGGGCIGIAVAVHMPWVRVDATDISEAALAVAARNVARHRVGDRVSLLRSDLFGALTGTRYDLIVANPPYVPARDIAALPGEYRAEPEIGLASGADGLDACLRIMLESPRHLDDQGILVCEVGESQQRLEERLPAVPFLWLEFSHGGGGVFLLEREDLVRARPAVERTIEESTHV